MKNDHVSERLFDIFDTSGDKEMNAKEFTCGQAPRPHACPWTMHGPQAAQLSDVFGFVVVCFHRYSQTRKRESVCFLCMLWQYSVAMVAGSGARTETLALISCTVQLWV